MNDIKQQILEVKRSVMRGGVEYSSWTIVRLKDIRRIEEVKNISAHFLDDGKERVFIATVYGDFFAHGNYKQLNQNWIDYMGINGID